MTLFRLYSENGHYAGFWVQQRDTSFVRIAEPAWARPSLQTRTARTESSSC